MSKKQHYPDHLKKAHADKVEAAVHAAGPDHKARTIAAVKQFAANYSELPSLEAKDEAVQDAFARLDEIAAGIFPS